MSTVYHAVDDSQPHRKKQFPQAQPGHKYCNDCEKEKPFKAFHRDKYSPDGYYTLCKECKKKRTPQSANPLKVTRSEEVRAKRRKREQRKREAKKAQQLLFQPVEFPQQVPLFEFKICPKCDPPTEKHLTEFAISEKRKDGRAGWCKECVSKLGRSEERKATEREYRKERRRDPEVGEIVREGLNRWRREHPESQQELTMRRNTRKKAATTERVSYKRVLARDGYFCYICEQDINPNAKKRSLESLTFDHIIPIQPRPGDPQGTHCEANIKPAHKVCNARKANKPLETLTPFDRSGP